MSTLREEHVIIVGSGYGGSILAAALLSAGKRVTLIEKDSHPKFAIGESSTPIANFLLEFLGRQYGLHYLRGMSNWSRWQHVCPEIAVGLKRGFSFFFHETGSMSMPVDPMRVAASPDDGIADTHWYRPEVDTFLLNHAIAMGASYLERTVVESVTEAAERISVVIDSESGGRRSIDGDFLVDATGGPDFSEIHLGARTEAADGMPEHFAVYTHFRGVDLMDAIVPPPLDAPYPSDDAALHHIFPGGWIWVLRFNNGITSAGASLERNANADRDGLNSEECWQDLLNGLPLVAGQFRKAVPVMPFRKAKRLSFVKERMRGRRWLCLPASCGFTDPLLSAGIALNLLGVVRIAGHVKQHGFTPQSMEKFLDDYESATRMDHETAMLHVSSLLKNNSDPKLWRLKVLAYFTAAIQQETRLRLDRLPAGSGFLFRENPEWTATACSILAMSQADPQATMAILEPWDLAGLVNTSRGFQYPATREDLIQRCHRIPAAIGEIDSMLAEARFL